MAQLLSPPPQLTRQRCVGLQEQTFPHLIKMSEFHTTLSQRLRLGATFPSITDCMAVVCANSVATMKPYAIRKQNEMAGNLRVCCVCATCPWRIYFHAQLGDSNRIWTLTKMHVQHSDSCTCSTSLQESIQVLNLNLVPIQLYIQVSKAYMYGCNPLQVLDSARQRWCSQCTRNANFIMAQRSKQYIKNHYFEKKLIWGGPNRKKKFWKKAQTGKSRMQGP
mgnify:CR=1 FL=1